jgi:hypothetical protein
LLPEDKTLRIRRNLAVVLALVLGATGILLATLATNAASAPKNGTTVVTPAGDDGRMPGGMGYDGQGDGMGYDTPAPPAR